MLSRLFIKKKGGYRFSDHARILLKMSDLNMGSANCTLRQTADGESCNEDLGRTMFFKVDGRLLIRDRAIFITVPDGIKAKGHDTFRGSGDTVSLWFLHEKIPRAIECRVDEQVRFSTDTQLNIDPKVGIGYKLTPISDVVKQDKRSSLRFSHQPGQGHLPVYSQVLFDLYICKTDQTYPTEGTLLPRIEQLHLIPPQGNSRPAEKTLRLEDLVDEFKRAIRSNPSEGRQVHVSKPYLEERHNRSILLELGFSDVLGLGSKDIGRNLHIKKPTVSRIKDRRDPHYLKVEDILVLHYGARSGLGGGQEYYELITEISKGGLENLTIRPLMGIREERGFKVMVYDFSVNGARFANSPAFMEYMLGKNHRRYPPLMQLEQLQNRVIFLNFYPRLRFNRDTDPYRPELPKRISILGKIVRGEIEWEDEEEKSAGRIRSFGVRFMYDPTEYSRDEFIFDRWEMIRPFKENRYFKSVHKSLNGLIAFLESHTKE